MSEKKSTDQRKRNFACVVYQESAPDNWLQLVEQLHVPCLISPLHDMDSNPDGVQKKPHWHVMLMYEGKQNPDTVRSIMQAFGGVGQEIVATVRGYARYLCHLDNPEKAQYDPMEVRSLSGADYFEIVTLASDRTKAIQEMQQWCIDNDVTSYAELSQYCSNERYDLFRVLITSTIHMSHFLKSRQWENEKEAKAMEAAGLSRLG